jgi:hypothetical protein
MAIARTRELLYALAQRLGRPFVQRIAGEADCERGGPELRVHVKQAPHRARSAAQGIDVKMIASKNDTQRAKTSSVAKCAPRPSQVTELRSLRASAWTSCARSHDTRNRPAVSETQESGRWARGSVREFERTRRPHGARRHPQRDETPAISTTSTRSSPCLGTLPRVLDGVPLS